MVEKWNNIFKFTKEEIAAMCVVALSLVDVKIFNPKTMMKFMHEETGMDEDEVYYKKEFYYDEL